MLVNIARGKREMVSLSLTYKISTVCWVIIAKKIKNVIKTLFLINDSLKNY